MSVMSTEMTPMTVRSQTLPVVAGGRRGKDDRKQNLLAPFMGYIGGHKVGRVLSFFFSRRNWDSPKPSPEGVCALPPLVLGGRGTLAGERGGGRVPIPTRGHTLWYSLYICTLWEALSNTKLNFCRESVLAGLAAAFSPAVDESFISSVRQKIDEIHSPAAFV
jgi:hypothetical protein